MMLFPYRGSKGGGGYCDSAPEQSHPPGEFPEAHRAAERPDWNREPNSTGQGECSDTEWKVESAA